MFKFEELRTYHEAIEFVSEVYKLTKKWPKEEIFGLTNQLRRASVSISLNIAEGSSRKQKDFMHFLDMSRGSVFECVSIIIIAKNQMYITEKEYETLRTKCLTLAKMISKLKTSLTKYEPKTN